MMSGLAQEGCPPRGGVAACFVVASALSCGRSCHDTEPSRGDHLETQRGCDAGPADAIFELRRRSNSSAGFGLRYSDLPRLGDAGICGEASTRAGHPARHLIEIRVSAARGPPLPWLVADDTGQIWQCAFGWLAGAKIECRAFADVEPEILARMKTSLAEAAADEMPIEQQRCYDCGIVTILGYLAEKPVIVGQEGGVSRWRKSDAALWILRWASALRLYASSRGFIK